jgi:hypothetical protein
LPPVLFHFDYFGIRIWVLCFHRDPPIYVSCVAGMTGLCHHSQLLLIKMGYFLPRLSSDL